MSDIRNNYHLFSALKDHMRGQHYENDDTVQEAVQSWLQVAGMDFYCRRIFKLVQCWQKCVDCPGDFV